MKYLLITLILLLNSCASVSNKKPNVEGRNPQTVNFNILDSNQDGKVTEQETKKYNDLKKTDTDLLTPIYVSVCILLVSVAACTILVKIRNGNINT